MKNNMIIYSSKDGNVRIDVNIRNDNIWMSQDVMANLYDTTKQNISYHLNNIFKEKELNKDSVVKNLLTTASDDKKYNVLHYNLDAIIAVGYRINSRKATEFRIWATKVLRDYLIKGYNLNVEQFKNNGYNPYFDELLEKIRDIRSSEKVFWRKILDIYSTSIDYNPKEKITLDFFRTIQNKMHYAVSKNTAAEIVWNRVDSTKNNIGLTNFKGEIPTKSETEVAKNYLSVEELEILNRLVSAYLDIAEINALKGKVMTMKDWIKELDSFLTMTHNDILNSKGNISHEQALKKAHEEYNKYMKKHLTRVEKDYLEIMNIEVKELVKEK